MLNDCTETCLRMVPSHPVLLPHTHPKSTNQRAVFKFKRSRTSLLWYLWWRGAAATTLVFLSFTDLNGICFAPISTLASYARFFPTYSTTPDQLRQPARKCDGFRANSDLGGQKCAKLFLIVPAVREQSVHQDKLI